MFFVVVFFVCVFVCFNLMQFDIPKQKVLKLQFAIKFSVHIFLPVLPVMVILFSRKTLCEGPLKGYMPHPLHL